jgi:hypothetical protein
MPWNRLSGRKAAGMALVQMGLAVWNLVGDGLGLLLGELWSSTPAVATTRRDYTMGTRCQYEEVDLYCGFLLRLVSFRNGHLCVCNGIVRERGRDFL